MQTDCFFFPLRRISWFPHNIQVMLNFIHHTVTHELLIYMECINTGAMYMYSFVPLIQGGGMKMFFLITYKQSFFSNIITCNTCWTWEQTTKFWCLIFKFKNAKQFYFSSHLIQFHLISSNLSMIVIVLVCLFLGFFCYIIKISYACIWNKS